MPVNLIYVTVGSVSFRFIAPRVKGIGTLTMRKIYYQSALD